MAEKDIIYLTRAGFREKELKLNYFKNVRRSEVAERLRRALEEGGELIENAEYADAKQEQGMIEGEINYLEVLLSRARILDDVDGDEPLDTVRLNTHVTVQEAGYDPETFWLVGSAEANPREGKISDASPLGAALLGSKLGEKVKINAPDGDFEYKIISIERA